MRQQRPAATAIRSPSGHVDQRAAAVDEVVLGAVVPKVRRDVDVGDRGGVGKELVARSAADGHRANVARPVARHAHPVVGGRQRSRHGSANAARGHGLGERPTRPVPTPASPGSGTSGRRSHSPSSRARASETPGIGVIGVRVGAEEGDPVRDEGVDDAALGSTAATEWTPRSSSG